MDLYTEIILDHYKNPQRHGTLEYPTARVMEYNPLCGDKIQIDLKVGKDGKVEDIVFSGTGCAISQAATSMLMEELLGKTLKEIKKMQNEIIYDMLKVTISPGRVKCALLGLVAAKKAAILAEAKHAQHKEVNHAAQK